MCITYRIITTRSIAIRQRLPDKLVEPFFLLIIVIIIIIIVVVGAHEAGYDEGHSDACVSGLERCVCIRGKKEAHFLISVVVG